VRNIETGSGGDIAFKDANILTVPEKTMTASSLGRQESRPSLRHTENNNPIQNIKIESERSQPSGMQTDENAIQEKGDNSPMRWEKSDTPTRETVLQEKLPSAPRTERILKMESRGRPNVFQQRDIVFQQIMPSMVRMVKEGRSRVMMALRPKELGRLRMELTSEKGRMQAKFFVGSGEVKETLERSLPELRTGLEKQGIEVHQFDVQVAREFSRPSEYGERMMKGNGEDLNTEERSHEEVLDEDTGQKSRKGPRYFGYNSMEIYA
jgi:flagellar hook-length control protein FliK